MSHSEMHVRTLRRKWGLSQRELASLLPKGSRNRVSRVERELLPPSATEILAYRVIFGVTTKAAFPRFFAHTEEEVMRRAYKLHRRLERRTSPLDLRKRKLLEEMLARATGRDNRRGA